MTTLGPLDSAFLRMDNRHAALNIGSVAIFDGPPPAYDEILQLLTDKITYLPHHRQKLREPGLWLGKPSWVLDHHFRLDDHLRHTALPRPGSPAQLDNLVGRVMAQPLDRGRPLWECWIVEGLAGNRWALINKVHHCMADGIAGMDLLEFVLDHCEQPSQAERQAWVTQHHANQPDAPGRSWSGPSLLRHPQRVTQSALKQTRGLLSFAGLAWPARSSSVTGPIGGQRCWIRAQLSMQEVRAIRSQWGVTVNDVVLTAVTRGFRELLLSRGEDPREHSIRTLVPVSARTIYQKGEFDNRVTAMIADLPIAEAYPVQRLHLVRHELDRLKRSGEPEAGVLLTEVARWIPALMLNAAVTGIFRVPQRAVVTVATNVPGPRERLYAVGRELLALYPYVPIADHLRIGVAVTSYQGHLYVGVTADRDSSRDIAVLAAGIEREVHELLQIAQPTPRSRPAKRGDVGWGSNGSKVRSAPHPEAPVTIAEGS